MAFDGKIGNICVLFQVPIMCMYQVHVTTGDRLRAGTNDHVFVTLVGTNGESERTELNNYGIDFRPDQVRNCSPGFASPRPAWRGSTPPQHLNDETNASM